MADVFTLRLADGAGSVPAPIIQGIVIPSADNPNPVNSLGLRQPIGFGTTTRRFVSVEETFVGDEGLSAAALAASVINGINQARSPGDAIRFEISGITGPAGPAGRDGINALPAAIAPAGSNALGDIDIPIPYNGWEGAFTNNDPNAGEVSWTSFNLTYKGTKRIIAANASGTSNAYLYWDVSSNPTTILSTGTRSNAVGSGKFLVGWNNSGTFNPSQFMKLLTAGFISVVDLAALSASLGTITSGSITLNTGNDTRLRLDSSGLYISNNAGSTYQAIIFNDNGTIKLSADELKVGTLLADRLTLSSLSGITGSFFKVLTSDSGVELNVTPAGVATYELLYEGPAIALTADSTVSGTISIKKANAGSIVSYVKIELHKTSSVASAIKTTQGNVGWESTTFDFAADATTNYHIEVWIKRDSGTGDSNQDTKWTVTFNKFDSAAVAK